MNDILKVNVDDYKCYFFDIFDTLIFRKVSPEYVKKIWANHTVKLFDLNISMVELYNTRNKIEFDLCKENYSKGYDSEFKYYDLIYKIYNNYSKLIDEEFDFFYEKCRDIELSIEKSVEYLDLDLVDFIKNLKKKKKKIYLISDMYLSKDMLKKLLQEHNLLSFVDDIYVSCEFLKNKKTGNLYDIVLKELNVFADDCLMIGDNIYSDYEVPIQKKIDAIHLNREKQHKFYESYDKDKNPKNVLTEFEKISLASNNNFEHIIFSLYVFIEKLYFELLLNEKEEVIFLSREGEFLKKLFDIYCSKIYNSSITSKYLLVSRKATYLPSLNSIESENFSNLLKQYSNVSPNDFLKSLNFNEKEVQIILDSIFDNKEFYDKKINDFNSSDIFKKIISSKKFVDLFEKKRINQRKNFIKYINQITTKKDLTLVDVGWNGSIQDNIEKILKLNYSVNGYYLGLDKRDNVYNKNKKGLIFSNVPFLSNNYKLYSTNRTIYEILLGASHGSANGYEEKNNKIVVDLFQKKEEKDIFDNVISKIQTNMLKMFNELCDLLSNGYYDNIDMDKKINKIHFNMMYHPTNNQINFFNNIYHYENFGFFEFTEFGTKNKICLKFKFKQYIKFFLHFKVYFNDCLWPMLKLCNNDMKFAKFIYRNLKKIQFIKKKII